MSSDPTDASDDKKSHATKPLANLYPASQAALTSPAINASGNCLLSQYLTNLPSVLSSFSANSTERQLPADYEPNDFDVVCGRGKGSYDRDGNRTFRLLVARYVDEYEGCETKIEKSRLLERIVAVTKEQNNGQTHFVKYNRTQNRWYEVSNDHAREKVGHTMRVAVASKQEMASSTTSGATNGTKKKDPPPVKAKPSSSLVKHQLLSAGGKPKGPVEANAPTLLDNDIHQRQAMIFRRLAQDHAVAVERLSTRGAGTSSDRQRHGDSKWKGSSK